MDARLASLLGGERFLPLGQEWQVISRWRAHLAEITAQQRLDRHHPWILDLDSQVGDVLWLKGVDLHE